jgi:hypothetical protein
MDASFPFHATPALFRGKNCRNPQERRLSGPHRLSGSVGEEHISYPCWGSNPGRPTRSQPFYRFNYLGLCSWNKCVSIILYKRLHLYASRLHPFEIDDALIWVKVVTAVFVYSVMVCDDWFKTTQLYWILSIVWRIFNIHYISELAPLLFSVYLLS